MKNKACEGKRRVDERWWGEDILKFKGQEKKRQFWKTVNSVRRVRGQVSESVLGTNGEVLEGKDVVIRWWDEHFESLLNEN